MFRKHPKKQDHGTRGNAKENELHWGNIEKGVRLDTSEERNRKKNIARAELKKLCIDCTDEEIEEYERRSQFVPTLHWYFYY